MDQPQRRPLHRQNLFARSFLAPLALLALAAVATAACGGGTTDAGSDSVSTDPVSTDPVSTDTVSTDAITGTVIGTGNINGAVVDPKPHPIDGIEIAESYPEQLMIGFTAGDESCLAADARAEAVGDQVIVTLEVGITSDAASRSCVAGEFTHTLTIPLDEGLDGRTLVVADS